MRSIEEMADEAYGTDPEECFMDAYLRRFAALVAEECASICDDEAEGHRTGFGTHCANVIRERFKAAESCSG